MNESKGYVWDDRAPAFRTMGETAALIAEKYCGVDIDDVTRERWCDGGALMREIDTFHDDFGASEEEVVRRLESYEDFKELYPSLAPGVLDDGRREKMMGDARRIMKIGRFISKTTSPYRYARLRGAEARISADGTIDASTDYVLEQERFWNEFVPIFRSFAIGACAFDSTLDSYTDYKSGKSAIRPSLEYYSELLKLGTKPMLYGMRPLLHPEIAKQGLIMARMRIKNRIENGFTEHSTMQNIRTLFKH